MQRPILTALLIFLSGILMPLRADSKDDQGWRQYETEIAKARQNDDDKKLGELLSGRMSIFYNLKMADSITAHFEEDMKDAFRSLMQVEAFRYRINNREYDRLLTYSTARNGSHIHKQGIEWQYQSPRIPVICTRFTINGAWLRTTYSNSEQMFSTEKTPGIVNGVNVQDHYIGLYNWTEGYIREIHLVQDWMAQDGVAHRLDDLRDSVSRIREPLDGLDGKVEGVHLALPVDFLHKRHKRRRLAGLPRGVQHEVAAPLDDAPDVRQPFERRKHVMLVRETRARNVEKLLHLLCQSRVVS